MPGRGRGRGRGGNGARGRSGQRHDSQDDYQLKVTPKETDDTEIDVLASLSNLFTGESSFEKHFAAQENDRTKYMATLLVLQRVGTDILQSSKARTLAAAWARKDHELADTLLANPKAFGLVEVLKAVTLLDSGRKMREWEKKLKRFQMLPKIKAHKLTRIKTTIHNLNAIKPSVGSMSGAISRHIRRWVGTISASELEFYALHLPKNPWKKLADLVHFNPEKDFKLPWFLSYCFGKAAPDSSLVSKCASIDAASVNELILTNDIPYAHIKTLNASLTDKAKERVVGYEKSLDTVLWNYEDLECPVVDSMIEGRLQAGESVNLPYGKIMERLLLIKEMREGNDLKKEQKVTLYDHLIAKAQKQLEHTRLSIESPVAVIGDRSPSMGVAIKTSTIIASLLCAISKAELSFFSNKNYIPPEVPRNIKEVLEMATSIKTDGSTIPAASLRPYYDEKKVIKTFIIITDEYENGTVKIDGEDYNFKGLFQKYHKEIFPAKLVFVSFLRSQHSLGQMTRQLKSTDFTPVQFKLDSDRPDLVKLGRLLGMLSRETVGFSEEISAMEAEITAGGLEKAIKKITLQK